MALGRLQFPDRQIARHAVAIGPADHTAEVHVQDDCQIQPPIVGSDVADITCLFLVRPVDGDVSVQKVRRDVAAMVAVDLASGELIPAHLELPVLLHSNAVLTHQTANTTMPDIKAKLRQFFGHSEPAVAA